MIEKEVNVQNSEIAKSLGFLTIWFSRLDSRLAYAILFLTCDSMSLTDEVHKTIMLQSLSCSMFGSRLDELKKITDEAELSHKSQKEWNELIGRLRTISTYRNDLQHGVWQGSPEGLGTVYRRRPGKSRPIQIMRWSSEQIRLLAKAIHDEIQILDYALFMPEIAAYRAAQSWCPRRGLDQAALSKIESTPLPANQYLDQLEKLIAK